MAKISKAARRALAEAQNWRCAYCTAELDIITATADHVVPRGVGGRTSPFNLVCACVACNGARGADIDVWAFWKLRSRLREAGLWPEGTRPGAEITAFLKAHRAYTRAKLALHRRARTTSAPAKDLLISDLVETLNDGCTLTALQITRLRRPHQRCSYVLPAASRVAAGAAERQAFDCLWEGIFPPSADLQLAE